MEYLFVTSVAGNRVDIKTKKLFFATTESAIKELNQIYKDTIKNLKKGYGICCSLFDEQKKEVLSING